MSISKLRLRCMELGGPQYMIAARAGMTPSRLSEYCLLQREIPQHHILALCNLFECEPDDIVGISDTDEYSLID